MKIKEIIRKRTLPHSGYIPTSISYTKLTTANLKIFRQLKLIPRKITAYFKRNKIITVYKSDCFKNNLDNYYIIYTVDGTLFHITY